MPERKQREFLNFENNVPQHVTLDSDLLKVKGIEKETNWGLRTYYPVWVNGDKTIWSSQALFEKLSPFSRGDSIVITKAESEGRIKWVVNPAGTAQSSNGIQKDLQDTEITVALRGIFESLDQIRQHLGIGKNDDKKEEYPQDEKELNF